MMVAGFGVWWWTRPVDEEQREPDYMAPFIANRSWSSEDTAFIFGTDADLPSPSSNSRAASPSSPFFHSSADALCIVSTQGDSPSKSTPARARIQNHRSAAALSPSMTPKRLAEGSAFQAAAAGSPPSSPKQHRASTAADATPQQDRGITAALAATTPLQQISAGTAAATPSLRLDASEAANSPPTTPQKPCVSPSYNPILRASSSSSSASSSDGQSSSASPAPAVAGDNAAIVVGTNNAAVAADGAGNNAAAAVAVPIAAAAFVDMAPAAVPIDVAAAINNAPAAAPAAVPPAAVAVDSWAAAAAAAHLTPQDPAVIFRLEAASFGQQICLFQEPAWALSETTKAWQACIPSAVQYSRWGDILTYGIFFTAAEGGKMGLVVRLVDVHRPRRITNSRWQEDLLPSTSQEIAAAFRKAEMKQEQAKGMYWW